MNRLARHDERGAIGGLEAVVFGVLVFVAGTLFVASSWAVVDTKLAVTTAAREAARRYVEAPSAEAAGVAAHRAAGEVLSGFGRQPARAEVRLSGSFQRCGTVVVEVSYPVTLIVPAGGSGRGPTLHVRARHAERVDPYRSGLPGAASCDG